MNPVVVGNGARKPGLRARNGLDSRGTVGRARAELLAVAAMASLWLAGCSSGSFVSILQNGKEYRLSPRGTNSVEIARSAFRIRAWIEPYDEKNLRFFAVKLLVADNEEALRNIKAGDSVADEHPFGNGKGFAIEPDNSSLFVTEEGYNYLFYEEDKIDGSPLKPRTIGGKRCADAVIIGLRRGEKAASIEQWTKGPLYAAFFYDGDLDERIGPGELAKVELTFREP